MPILKGELGWVFGQRAILEYLRNEPEFKRYFNPENEIDFYMLNEVLLELNNCLIE